MPNVIPFAGGMAVMPDLVAGARIECPNIIRNGEVENAIDKQRRGFVLRGWPVLEGPGKRERIDVLRSDLCERAVTPAGVVAVIGRPAVDWRMQKHLRIHALLRVLCQHYAGRRNRDQRSHRKKK